MTALMSCEELVELITEYLEGALPETRKEAFEEHIAICPPCRAYLAEIRKTVAAAGTLTEDDIPPSTREAMLDVFRNWNRQSR
jgi:anti-sigma factor RsiW